MARQSFIISISFVVSCLLVFSYSIIFTNSSSPPLNQNTNGGHTGSPIDNGLTCAKSGCHAGSAVQDNGNLIQLNIGTSLPPSDSLNGFEFSPNTKYTILLDVTEFNNSKYGFQLSAIGPNGNQAGTFATNSNDASIKTPSSGNTNVQYVGHSGASSNATWLIDWTSPADSVGWVNFYIAANDANANNNPTGDDIYRRELTACNINTSLSPNDSTQICEGDSLTLSASVTNAPSDHLAYDWSGSAQGDSTVIVTSSGSYQVTITDTSNGCSTVTSSVAVNTIPSPNEPTIQQDNNTLTATGTGNSVSYQWLRDGNPISNATDSVYVANQDGNYAVQVTNSSGCTVTSQTVNVTGTSIDLKTGDQPIALQRVTREAVHIHVDEQRALQVNLYDITGRHLYSSSQQEVQKGQHRFELPEIDVDNQIVLIHISTEQGGFSRKVFLK